MVARLTPDQKVACSIHVEFNLSMPAQNIFFEFQSFNLLEINHKSIG